MVRYDGWDCFVGIWHEQDALFVSKEIRVQTNVIRMSLLQDPRLPAEHVHVQQSLSREHHPRRQRRDPGHRLSPGRRWVLDQVTTPRELCTVDPGATIQYVSGLKTNMVDSTLQTQTCADSSVNLSV